MALELIDTSAREVLDLLKTEYYNQTGKTIQIGSDEFAQSAVQAYVWPILFNTINNATKNRFIDYARGEFLDALASNFGVNSRPEGYHATALFNIYPQHTDTVIHANSLVVQDDNGNAFTNKYEISPRLYNLSHVLYAVNSGSEYNGIPIGAIDTIIQGAEFAQSAINTTMSNGGTNGFPYTEDGDNSFREWLKNYIKSLSGAGTAAAFEGRAYNADSRVSDVYVIKQSDSGYQKGKVQIYILAKGAENNDEIVQIVQSYCEDPVFRPIGDLVEVRYAALEDLDISKFIQTSYPSRFVDFAYSRNNEIIQEYKDILAGKIGKPFAFDEFCSMFTKKDDSGIYATDAKPIIDGINVYPAPIYPPPGSVINLQSVSIDVKRDPNAD
jgi:phage-related baseplate assembly protein